jgi:hypothetical protein
VPGPGRGLAVLPGRFASPKATFPDSLPFVRSTGVLFESTGGTTSYVLNMPKQYAPSDLLLASFTVNAAANQDVSVVPPGWKRLAGTAAGTFFATFQGILVYYRIVEYDDVVYNKLASTYTWTVVTSAAGSGNIAAIGNVDLTDLTRVVYREKDGTPSTINVVPPLDGCLVATFNSIDSGSTDTTPTDGSFSRLWIGAGQRNAGAFKIRCAAGVTVNAGWTGGTNLTAVVVVLKPNTAIPTPVPQGPIPNMYHPGRGTSNAGRFYQSPRSTDAQITAEMAAKTPDPLVVPGLATTQASTW